MILEIGSFVRLKDDRLARVLEILEDNTILVEIVEGLPSSPSPTPIYFKKETDEDEDDQNESGSTGDNGGGFIIENEEKIIGYIHLDDIAEAVTISTEVAEIEEVIDHGI